MMYKTKHFNSLKELIDYRNKLMIRAKARTKAFNDHNENYYWYRLNEIEKEIGIMTNIGNITIKGTKQK